MDKGRDREAGLNKSCGLSLLKKNTQSNLGWRILLEFKDKSLAASCVQKAGIKLPLIEVIPHDFRASMLQEVEKWSAQDEGDGGKKSEESEGLTIKSASFQGASDPNGIRTRVTAVKGRCPRPLDDRVRKAGAISEARPDVASYLRSVAPRERAVDSRFVTSVAVRPVAPLCRARTA